MLKVLQLVVAVNDGGIERLLYDYYSNMNSDEIIFDFAINDTEKGILEDPLKLRGSQIYRYVKFRKNFFGAVKDINRIIDKGEYDVIHSHLGNRAFLSLIHAKRKGCKFVISHCHSANEKETLLQLLFRKVTTEITKRSSDYLLACGEDAGKWMWGANSEYRVMKNAIQIDKFIFDEQARDTLRENLEIKDKQVFLCVGRLSEQKNQERLVDIFYEYQKEVENSVLLLVGTGDKLEIIREKIRKYNIGDKIKILGVRTDVNKLLSVADIYILTSKYEGLPISVIEAQCSGLSCILSDAITKEVALSENVKYCSLDDTNSTWVKAIKEVASFPLGNRRDGVNIVRGAGYDIKIEADKMYHFYKEAARCD